MIIFVTTNLRESDENLNIDSKQ